MDCLKVVHSQAARRVQYRAQLRFLKRKSKLTRNDKKRIKELEKLTINRCGRCGDPTSPSRRLCDNCRITRRRMRDAAYRRNRLKRTIYSREVDGYPGEVFAPMLTQR